MDPGNINVIWERALAEYEATTKESLTGEKTKTALQRILNFWNHKAPSTSTATDDKSTNATADTEKSLATYLMEHTGTFQKARKNGKWNKIGHILGQYTSTAKDLISIAGTGASLPFPPASIIVLVTTHAAGAISTVSTELNAIEELFEVMTSFGRRVNLLKDRVPPEPEYQAMVIEVFCNMLAFCGDVSRRVKEGLGKVSAFFKALIRGGDPMVKAACDNVLNSIHRLDSATIFQTLATTVEISTKIDSLRSMAQNSFDGLQTNVSGIRAELNKQSRRDAQRDNRVKRVDENTTIMLELLLGGNRGGAVDTKSQKFRSLEIVTQSLSTGAEGHIVRRLIELEQTRVAGIFDWLAKSDIYTDLIEGRQRDLYVSGDCGTGKSFMAYSIYSDLRTKFDMESSSVVAYFAFDSRVKELRTVNSMLKFCSVQVAQQNDSYQRYIRELISKKLTTWTDDDCWMYLFGTETKDIEAELKVYIVLDGMDELEESEMESFNQHLRHVQEQDPSQSKLQTYLVMAGSLETMSHIRTEIPSEQTILLDKEKLRKSGDLKKLTETRLDSSSFPKLSRLKYSLRQQILDVIDNNADTFLYIDHMLRRLNAIGSVYFIRKELERPPQSTHELYKWLLEECARAHTLKEQEMLGYLFTWLAHSKMPLSLDAAQQLLNIVAKLVSSDTIVNIEEEARGRMSKILAILDADAERPDDPDSSDTDDHQCNYKNGISQANLLEDEQAFINFQESSLREYFKGNHDKSSDPLRPSVSAARLMLFKMSIAILTGQVGHDSDNTTQSNHTRGLAQLRAFAAKSWRVSLSGIMDEWTQLADNSIDRASWESVVLGLSQLLDGDNGGLKVLEKEVTRAFPVSFEVEALPPFSILGPTEDDQLDLLDKLEELAIRTKPLGLELGGSGERWFEKAWNTDGTPVAPSTAITAYLSKRHVKNWIEAKDEEAAYTSARFAVRAIYCLPFEQFSSLVGGTKLMKIFNIEPPTCEFYEEIVKFGQWDLDANAYRKISMALYIAELNTADSDAALKGLEIIETVDKTAHAATIFSLKFVVARSWFEVYDVQNLDAVRIDKDEYLANLDVVRIWLVDAVEAAKKISVDSEEYPELKPTINLAYQMLALVQTQFKEHLDSALGTMRLAEETSSPDTWRRYFNPLIQIFAENKMWESVIELTEILDNPLADEYRHPRTHRCIHRAAKACKRGDHVRELYHKAACRPVLEGAKVPGTRLQWATLERFVRMDTAAAKEQLYKILSAKTTTFYLRSAAQQLVNIILEEFRLAKTYDAKEAAVHEMERVVEKVQQRHGFEFRPELSAIPIPLAIMRKKMGPTRAFYTALNASFNACLEALQDDSPTNDADSLRLLAWILCLVSDDREDARLALTCCFYNVTRLNDVDGDAYDPGMVCSACWNSMPTLDPKRKIHMCLVCTDVDLCAGCYKVATAGEEDESYVKVCPGGHEYLGFPADDWEGVKGGVLRYGGKEVPFATWREGLREKWRTYWEEYCLTQLRP
ncbi:hypothetical protein TWF696_003202 [Orbilia brochopaga]|uniref:Nephrocystin 3-like N-terminal domain-containing protein n=1 Tax=Orbilia brochopaga TaxID=3140254 RepID=A0AAV9TYF8_9PEZI